MEQLPHYISLAFIAITLAALLLFLKATSYARPAVIITIAWLALQGILSARGFYTSTAVVPPPFMLAILPPFILMAIIFILPGGRRFTDSLSIRTLTLLQTVRILVELVLVLLYQHKKIPLVMTFEGHNFDILSGLTAPIIYYLVFVKRIGYKFLLIWNILCLILLINIVVTAVLSAPFRFQQFAFEQPNIAILYFPFTWLPSFIVPVAFFAHLVSIRQIIKHRAAIVAA